MDVADRVSELRDAEREGSKAYYAGARINTNPHWKYEDKALYQAWRDGWLKSCSGPRVGRG